MTQDSRREKAQKFESGHRCAFCCISERSHQSTAHRSKGRWEEGVQFDIRLAADSDVNPQKALSTLTLMFYSKTYPRMHRDNLGEKKSKMENEVREMCKYFVYNNHLKCQCLSFTIYLYWYKLYKHTHNTHSILVKMLS